MAISPLSLSLALQVAYNCAAGTTQQKMMQTLQLGPLTTQQLNDANAVPLVQPLLFGGVLFDSSK